MPLLPPFRRRGVSFSGAVVVIVSVVIVIMAWIKYSDSPRRVGPDLCRQLLTKASVNIDGHLADDMTVTQASDGSYVIGGSFVLRGGEAVPVGCSLRRVNGTWEATGM